MKIFVVGGDSHYANFLEGATLVDKQEDADVVLFTGGEDVSPKLYGCEKHPTTFSNLGRDMRESAAFKEVRKDQVCLGICRGSQFLCVMNGGLLVQDCSGHAIGYTHLITNGTYKYHITSTHHQMQYPYNLKDEDYTILYMALESRSDYYEGDKINANTIASKGEPEIVLYHKSNYPKCLAVQGHPEMMPNSPVAKMINQLVKKLVDDN